MSRLTETIECTDCGAERKVTKACLHSVTRCKPCQKAFNKDRARNRYREMNNIPTSKPVKKKAKPKPKPAKKVKAETKAEEIQTPVEEVKKERTPEEKKTAIARLMKMTEKYPVTTDEW